jgi:hypothetical protein
VLCLPLVGRRKRKRGKKKKRKDKEKWPGGFFFLGLASLVGSEQLYPFFNFLKTYN